MDVPDVLPDGQDVRCYKRLAAAVLMYAFKDLESGPKNERLSAAYFLTRYNDVLAFWCRWINLDPMAIVEEGKKSAWRNRLSVRL